MAPPRRTPYPSPLQLIAIINVVAEGMPINTAHRYSGYSHTTIGRWCREWGHDAKTFDNWVREHKIDLTGHRFLDYFPNEGKSGPYGRLGSRTELPHKFFIPGQGSR